MTSRSTYPGPLAADFCRRPGLLAGLACPAGSYCESFAEQGQPRPHWHDILAMINGATQEVLGGLQERVRRMRHQDGATYNPFDAPDGRGIPYALEMVPLPLTAEEWRGLESGLSQRAALLERVLADVYGPQDLLKSGMLPPELVFANPQFLHACHGIVPSGGRFLTLYAADCYRGADGTFRVLRDYGGNPTGLGYSLENRIVISRLLPELYHRTQIRRLAPFFQLFHTGMESRSAARREDPGIALLSPGPESPIYFEQALLSRYLGYPLVEGQDLTVRNGKVFLKKLAGLEPVDAIFRHVDDGHIDPFALRRDTTLGVAGLIQAAREGNVDIANPIGAGFVDTPLLSVLLERLCEPLLGEGLRLASHPALWCGEEQGRALAVDASAGWHCLPALDRAARLDPDPREAVAAQAMAVIARQPVVPSAVPVWSDAGMEMRPVMLRLFACATAEGFAVLPGGLAMTAVDVDTLLAGVPERLASKDIWVMSDRPVEPFSMMSGLHSVGEVRRSSDLPSRVADHLLWLGRYLERAEGQIRLLRSVFRRLAGEARPEDIPELEFLLSLLHSLGVMVPLPEQADPGREVSGAGLRELLRQREWSESVATVLKQVQSAARNVRDRLSRDCWRVIDRLEDFGEAGDDDPLDLLDGTLFTLSAFSGLAMEGMTRGLGWRFMDMGRRIERALNQIGLIRFALPQIREVSHNALEALLEVSDSIMTYRARYRTAFQLAPVLDLLLLDESNPKSLAFQLDQLAAHVQELPRQNERRFSSMEERLTLEMLTAVRLLDVSGMSPDSGEAPDAMALEEFLETMAARLLEFAQQISAHYLTRVTATPHFSVRLGENGP